MAVTCADVVVLGGGVIGMACAWRVAQRGAQVVLVDPAPGSGASAAAAGMLAPATELHPGEGALLRLSLHAAAAFPRYAAEVTAASGTDVGYRASGTLAVALEADDRARLADVRALQQRLGLDVQALTRRECRRLEPLLDPAVSGGTLAGGDHQVDPRRLWSALHGAARRAGVQVVAARGEVHRRDGRAVGVRLVGGQLLRAGRVVLAVGARARPDAPVRPVKGQILRLRMPKAAPVLSRVVRGLVRDRAVYLVPRCDGELVVGATSEDVGFNEKVTASGVYELLRDAQALVPAVGELEVAEVMARCRPGSPDNLPIVGASEVPGLVLATGHSRNGVLLSGVTADAVADLVTGGAVPAQLQACTPDRFGSLAAAREEGGGC